MKKQLLALSVTAALTACGSSDDNNNTNSEPMAPEFTGEYSAIATKLMNPSGTVTVRDGNAGQSLFYPNQMEGTFGTFSITAAGDWEYKIDTTNEVVVALVSSDMPSLVEPAFTLTAADGTTKNFSVTIDGVDVPATFKGDLSNKKVEYDNGDTAGKITVADANPAEAMFAATQGSSDVMAMYGAVTFDPATGDWTYDLDETNDAVKALTDSTMTLEDMFTVSSLDGTQAEVKVTIVGSDPVPAVVEGLPVDENGVSTVMVNVNSVDVSGALTITDPNFEQAKFQTQDAVATSYGTFSIDDAGAWTYKLDATNAEVVALKGDGTAPTPLMESIKVMSVDGTAVDIPITVNGLVGGNLAAQIGGGSSTGKLSIQLGDNPLKTGKISFKANLGENSAKNVDIILWGTRYHSDKYRSTMVLMPQKNGDLKFLSVQTQDASKVDDTFVLDQKQTPGQWFDVDLTWDATSAANGIPVKLTLAINGTPVSGAKISSTEFDAQTLVTSSIISGGSKFIEFVLGSDANTSFYIDDLVIYSDVAGTTQVLAEDFDGLAEGTPLNLAASDATRLSDTMVGAIAKP